MPPNIAHQPGLLGPGPPPSGMRPPPGPGMLPPRMPPGPPPPIGMPPMAAPPAGPGFYGAFYEGGGAKPEGPPDNLQGGTTVEIEISMFGRENSAEVRKFKGDVRTKHKNKRFLSDLAKLLAVSQVINKQNAGGANESGDNNVVKDENDVPNHLPPKQQELFKRIQQQQRDSQPTKDYGNWKLLSQTIFLCFETQS